MTKSNQFHTFFRIYLDFMGTYIQSCELSHTIPWSRFANTMYLINYRKLSSQRSESIT